MNNLKSIFGNSFTESRLKYVKGRLKLGLKPLKRDENFAEKYKIKEIINLLNTISVINKDNYK